MVAAVRGRRHPRRGPTRSHAYAACGREYVAAGGRARDPGGAPPLRPSLAGGLDAVLARCEAHTRYDVRRTLRRGVVVRAATRADLPAFWALERTAAARKAFAVRSPEFFDRLWNAWNGPGDGGRLLVGEYEGRVVREAWLAVPAQFVRVCAHQPGRPPPALACRGRPPRMATQSK